MNKFKPSKLTIALLSTGMLTFGAPVFAEQVERVAQAETSEATSEEEDDEQVVIVTGIRGSLARSQAIKMDSYSIVEAISAEDIGKLPDSSIAESIARLPGLTSQRLDGRSSRVSIRGFGENESGTTFNGREQVSISDNRGVEFDLYPSEIMSGVTVYKTPNATLDGEGIAGIIDMQTIKPLSKGEDRIIQVNGLYEKTSFDKLNPDGDDAGFSGTVFYMDKFVDDTVGLAVAFSHKDSPNQEKRWNAWGYPDFDVNGQNFSILGGAKPFVRSSTLERDSLMAVLEIAPSDSVQMTIDFLNVDFKDTKRLRGIEVPFAWGQGSVTGLAVDEATGFVTQALTEGQRVVVRNDFETREADLTSVGFNLEWFANETWTLDFDVSYSQVDRKVFSLESYSGTGRGDAGGVADDIGYTLTGGNTGATFTHGLNYGDFGLIQLGGPLTWGWSSALNDSLGITGTPLENSGQDGFINAPSIDDELTSLKFAAEQDIDNGTIANITYGIAFKEREKTKLSDGFFMTLAQFPADPGTLVVPEQYRLGTVSLDFIGMGDMIAYDPMALIRDGFYTTLSEALTGTQHLTKSWQVNEEVTSAFVSANIDTTVGGLDLTGNVGVRYVRTEQSSKGFAGNVVDGLVVSFPTDISHDYNHFLPSLNLILNLDETQNIRFGVAKTISRARLDQMNASVTTDFSITPDANGNNWSVSGGNPLLEPQEATGFDLTYDNYFSDAGYFSIAYFYKDLSNWIIPGNFEVDLTGVADPQTGLVPANPIASGSGNFNGGEGSLSGLELSLTLPLEMISESLDGFGVILSHTSIDSDMERKIDGSSFELPGLSDSIQNFTFYYEKNGFQARASMRKRDDFKGDVFGLGFDTVQVDIIGETIWDAQIGYDFGDAGFEELEGLSVYLQGQNLTEEPFTSLSGDNALQVRDYQDYGSTYLLGVNYKF